MNIHDFFNRHAADSKVAYFTPLVTPRRIAVGENYFSATKGIAIMAHAPVKGWQLEENGEFITDDVFRKNFTPVEIVEPQDLPENADVRPILSGETVTINQNELAMTVRVQEEGRIVTMSDGSRILMTLPEFQTAYKTPGEPLRDVFDRAVSFRMKTLQPENRVRWVMLEEDMTLDVNGEPAEGMAGDVLYRSKENGRTLYCLIPAEAFAENFTQVEGPKLTLVPK